MNRCRNIMKDLLLNTVSQRDEKLPNGELDDIAIPHIKIKITEIPLEKKVQYHNTIHAMSLLLCSDP